MTQNFSSIDKGKSFQSLVRIALMEKYNQSFEFEVAFPVGNPAKDHKFDLVSSNGEIIVKTKNYTWTESGNVPSAKLSVLNEAVFYLQHTPKGKTRIIVINYDLNVKKNESLANYYVKTYKHLLDDVIVMEYNQELCVLNEIR
ncbi:hypothetical protein ACFSTH_11540 [Paenibacillus yanchengensis]|uniref:Uncharacterized protein n=1 Tax=Paenibacillus yanchengensis TaxID=2035833 RepID=A0ABW4YPL3_9BACL